MLDDGCLAAAFIAAGVSLIGYGLLTPAKAWLAAILLDHAWARTLAGDEEVRLLPWMDSEPVARLRLLEVRAEPSGVWWSWPSPSDVDGSRRIRACGDCA